MRTSLSTVGSRFQMESSNISCGRTRHIAMNSIAAAMGSATSTCWCDARANQSSQQRISSSIVSSIQHPVTHSHSSEWQSAGGPWWCRCWATAPCCAWRRRSHMPLGHLREQWCIRWLGYSCKAWLPTQTSRRICSAPYPPLYTDLFWRRAVRQSGNAHSRLHAQQQDKQVKGHTHLQVCPRDTPAPDAPHPCCWAKLAQPRHGRRVAWPPARPRYPPQLSPTAGRRQVGASVGICWLAVHLGDMQGHSGWQQWCKAHSTR